MFDLSAADDKAVNDWLNERLGRTEFMPFAPVMLPQDALELLIDYRPDAARAAEFMTITYAVTDRCTEIAPAVVHVDRTARPQVVNAEHNPSMHRVLSEYRKLRGFGIMVNTSFNMHEEPIVRTPADAVRAFQRGGLHVLAIGNFLVTQDADRTD